MGAVDINQAQASDLATATMTLTAIPVTFTLGTATRDLAVATLTMGAVDVNYTSPGLTVTPVGLLFSGVI